MHAEEVVDVVMKQRIEEIVHVRAIQIQEALRNHDSWMEDVSNTLQRMQEKEENLIEKTIEVLKIQSDMNTTLDRLRVEGSEG